MTPAEIKAAKALNHCTFLPGSWEKRFAKHMAAIAHEQPDKPLTIKQREWLEKLCYMYRKQGTLPSYHRLKAEPMPESDAVVLGGLAQPKAWDAVLGGDRND